MANNVEEALARLQKNPQEYDATIAGNIERIEDSKLVIVDKEKDMGILSDETGYTIDDAALALNGIDVVKSGSERISQGQEYVVPAGYYTGVFKVVADGQGQDLEEVNNIDWNGEGGRSLTRAGGVITPISGKYGMSKVTIPAIPAKYQDVTSVTATATDVLTGKKIVGSDGTVIDGAMANNGKVTTVLDATTGKQTYTIAQGYHNGQGTVSIVLADKTDIVPTESEQTFNPAAGTVFNTIKVAAIDKDTYLTSWTNDATAVAANILTGKTAYAKGAKVTGTMADNSAWDAAEHILDTTSSGINISIPQGYHAAGGVVKVVTEDVGEETFNEAKYKAGLSYTASEDHVIKNVTIAALPANYYALTTTNTTATADDVLASKKFVNTSGQTVTGTIATVTSYAEDISEEIMGSGANGYTLNFNEAFYKNGGSVSIDGSSVDSLFQRLAAI